MIVALRKSRIVSSSTENKCVTLYDKNLKLVKRLDKINELASSKDEGFFMATIYILQISRKILL
jgi:hypothetical protein